MILDILLALVIFVKLVHIPLGVDFHPSGKYIYATGGYVDWESCIEEVSLDTLTQTRYLYYSMREGYMHIRHPKTLVVSDDGLWVYTLLQRPDNTPPSKLVAVKIDKPAVHKRAMPWIPLLLLED